MSSSASSAPKPSPPTTRRSGRPTVGVRKIEAVTITDDPMVQKLLIRATDKREGKTVLLTRMIG